MLVCGNILREYSTFCFTSVTLVLCAIKIVASFSKTTVTLSSCSSVLLQWTLGAVEHILGKTTSFNNLFQENVITT